MHSGVRKKIANQWQKFASEHYQLTGSVADDDSTHLYRPLPVPTVFRPGLTEQTESTYVSDNPDSQHQLAARVSVCPLLPASTSIDWIRIWNAPGFLSPSNIPTELTSAGFNEAPLTTRPNDVATS